MKFLLRYNLFYCILHICYCANIENPVDTSSTESPEETWTGRWLPERTTDKPVTSDLQASSDASILYDKDHGVKMGVPSSKCDNAKTNLEVDWDSRNSTRYMCLYNKSDYAPNINVASIIKKQNIPSKYMAKHVCMSKAITYDDVIPTFGSHRPLWPRYGEYKFLPVQRWLHNVEHGGIAMLYHPCANKQQVNKLRHLVSRCLWRHVITPMDTLSAERPLALVAWGWSLQMSFLDSHLAKEFIVQHALRGPERVHVDGQYSLALTEPAKIVSDKYDSFICDSF